ncbi:MAG: hypothetical protein AB7O59_16295 [Pirellulales bacterium]
MSEYLLPCSCGRKVVVSARHAGHSLRCECGIELEVPTLRGLQELEAQGAGTVARGRDWGNRQRVAFVLAAVAVAAAAIAGYLWTARPILREPPAPVEITQDTPMMDVYGEFQRYLHFGVAGEPNEVSPAAVELSRRLDLTMWGVRIAAAAAVCALVACVAVALSGGAQKR